MTTTTAAPGLTQIGQIAVNAYDTDRAIAVYRDTLGLTFLFQAGTLGFFDCGGVRLMLEPAGVAGVRSSGVGALLQGRRHPGRRTAALVSRGVTFIGEPLHHPPHAAIRPLDGAFQGSPKATPWR